MRMLKLAAAVLALAIATPAVAQQATKIEKPKLTLGVGGKPLLYYLPLTIAERKGFFKDEGLDVASMISAAEPSLCKPLSAGRSMW